MEFNLLPQKSSPMKRLLRLSGALFIALLSLAHASYGFNPSDNFYTPLLANDSPTGRFEFGAIQNSDSSDGTDFTYSTQPAEPNSVPPAGFASLGTGWILWTASEEALP